MGRKKRYHYRNVTLRSMMRGYFILLGVISFTLSVFITNAQDTQFSQFYANPVYMNAALTGSHSGTYRVSGAYRNQWAQSLDNPFTSFNMTGDFRINIGKGNVTDAAGAGILFNTDQIGVYNYDTYNIGLLGAYHKLLAASSKTYLSGGVYLGLGQRSLNYNQVTFEDQFNGQNGYTIATNELLPANNIGYPDLGLGLNFSTTPKRNTGVYIGASYYHLNEPTISFFGLDDNVTVPDENGVLGRRLTAHAAVSYPLNSLLTLLPRIIYNDQAQHTSLTFGTNFRRQIYEADASFVHIGAWMRSTKSLTTFQPTDITVMAGFEMGGLMVGFSYDIYLREIAGAAGTGTFEMTVSYTGSHENDGRICPTF